MDEHHWGFPVRKTAELLQPLRELLSRGRHMEHGAVGVIQRALSHQPVQIQHQLRIMALATSLVVAAPSIWEEVIAASISELSR